MSDLPPSRHAPTTADRRLAALFPEQSTAHTVWWKRRGAIVGLVVVIALVVTGGVAMSAFGSSGSSYRTATAGVEDVDSLLTGVATIEPVSQATVAFPVSGTVASVNVHVGDSVTASGTLASLDTTSLTQALHTKQSALAQAQLTLSKALSGESVGGVGTSGGAGNGSGGNGSSATTSAVRTGGAGRIVLTAAPGGSLAAAQQAVLAAQQQVDAAIAAADTALSTETSVCAPFASPAPTTTTTPPTSTTTPASPPDISACQKAIADVGAAQAAVAAAQKNLAAASSALDALLAQQEGSGGATGGAGGSGGSGASGATGGSGSGGSGASSRSGSGGSSPSAADLVAYQQAVDAAAAAVNVAQQSVDAATIASPIAGTVVAVNLDVGETVSADSSTANVVVQGAGGYEVSTTVNVDAIPSVSVGQPASVLPDGSHREVAGKVVQISVAPASTSSTGALYRVVIGLTDPTTKLDDGATGTVSIVTHQAKAALAVPTSAVTTTRNRHTVEVMRGGSPTAVPVQVGVVGSVWTQIKSGLHAGDEVVLADVSAPLPGSATASSATTNGGTGFPGFGAGGFGGFGGFGGGGTGRTGTRSG